MIAHSASIRSIAILTLVLVAIGARDRRVHTQSIPSGPFVVTDLGTLGGASSDAFAVNESGIIAGRAQRADGATHGFFYDGSLHDLGTVGSGTESAALGINRPGQVVGRAVTALGNTKGFIWTAGTLRSLGTLGGSHSAAFAINDLGDVVGSATTSGNAATRAFLYRNGVMKSLGTLGGTNSIATGITFSGDIIGSSSTRENASTHAFLFTGGSMHDLGTLGGTSEALGISDIGDIVGRSAVASGAMHAFVYSGGVMTDIGTLGGVNSQANAVNANGQVVGTSELPGTSTTHAFTYDRGVMIDLNTKLPSDSGWVLETATGINLSHDIVGTGIHNGVRHAYRLSPPATLRLSIGGALTQSESNLPRNGVQVGRHLVFIDSISEGADANAHDIVYTDTVTGPVEVTSAASVQGNRCSVSGRTVTCRIAVLGPGFTFDDEIHVSVKVTGPGRFSHTAHVTAANVTPTAQHTLSEENIGIALKSFTLSSATVAGGKAVSARAELTSLAPPGGAVVTLASSNSSIAPVPSTFVVQLPTNFRTFNIVPPVVDQPTTVTISATYGLVTISQTLTVLPPALARLSLTRSTMIGSCQTATAQVTLNGVAPAGGARVALTSTTGGVHVPSGVTVVPGATTASVTVTADAVHTLMNGVLRASFGGATQELSLAVRPIFLTGVTLTPSTVTGGARANGIATIECAAPVGGLAATLTSTKPNVAAPAIGTLMIAAGATAGSFAVTTHPVAAATTLSIRAAANGVTRSAALTVKP
jgi:probable HAF family extracellular repeat protein